mgnify:CR=1 FL=1
MSGKSDRRSGDVLDISAMLEICNGTPMKRVKLDGHPDKNQLIALQS